MAAGIIFIVILQLRVALKYTTIFIFECVKSLLATLLWLWLMLDAVFGPWQQRWKNRNENDIAEEKKQRLARAAVSVILLV